MTISAPSASSIARSAPQRTPRSIRPVPKPTPKPLVYGRAAQKLIEVEGDLFHASTELVFQRDDLIEAASPENNHALGRALRALDDGDLALARELIRFALHIEQIEDGAVERAQQRRTNAHDYQRQAVGRVEEALTGRVQP